MDSHSVLSTDMDHRTTLLDLPVELRYMIYKYCLALQPPRAVDLDGDHQMTCTDDKSEERPKKQYFDTALFYVCRTISEEARVEFYRMHRFTRVRVQMVGSSLSDILLGEVPKYSPLGHLTFRSPHIDCYDGPIMDVDLTVTSRNKALLALRVNETCFVRQKDLTLFIAVLSWRTKDQCIAGDSHASLQFEARDEAWNRGLTESALQSVLGPWRHFGDVKVEMGHLPAVISTNYLEQLRLDVAQHVLPDHTILALRDAMKESMARARAALVAGKPHQTWSYCSQASDCMNIFSDRDLHAYLHNKERYDRTKLSKQMLPFCQILGVAKRHLTQCAYLMEEYYEPNDERELARIAYEEAADIEVEALEDGEFNGTQSKSERQRLARHYLRFSVWDYAYSYPGCVRALLGARDRMATLKQLYKSLGKKTVGFRAELDWTAQLNLPIPSWRNGISWAEYVRHGLGDYPCCANWEADGEWCGDRLMDETIEVNN